MDLLSDHEVTFSKAFLQEGWGQGDGRGRVSVEEEVGCTRDTKSAHLHTRLDVEREAEFALTVLLLRPSATRPATPHVDDDTT